MSTDYRCCRSVQSLIEELENRCSHPPLEEIVIGLASMVEALQHQLGTLQGRYDSVAEELTVFKDKITAVCQVESRKLRLHLEE